MSNATYRQMTGPDGLLATRQEFQGNSLYSRWLGAGYWPGSGRLNIVEQRNLDYDVARSLEARKRLYVVYSYSTPIAWALEDEPAYCVVQRFSVTTTKSQGYVQAWIDHRYDSEQIGA